MSVKCPKCNSDLMWYNSIEGCVCEKCAIVYDINGEKAIERELKPITTCKYNNFVDCPIYDIRSDKCWGCGWSPKVAIQRKREIRRKR